MSNLVPEKRVDKNGVLTTKHVKSSVTPVPSKPLPAPSLKVTARKRPLKLLQRQTTPQDVMSIVRYDEVDAELTDRMAKNGEHYGHKVYVSHRFNASEEEFYDVHSVLSRQNATLLMHHGVRSKDEALELLHKLHLDRLIQPNADLTAGLLARRVPFDPYERFSRAYPYTPDAYDLKTYLDATELASLRTYQRLETKDGEPLHAGILNGQFDLADVRTMGVERLRGQGVTHSLLPALTDIKKGRADYDAAYLASYLDSKGSSVETFSAMRMLNKYGAGFMSQMTSVLKTIKVDALLESAPLERKHAVLLFNSRLDELFNADNDWDKKLLAPFEVIEAYDAGLEPERVVRLREEGLSLEQIIGTHKDNISSSVASGWL